MEFTEFGDGDRRVLFLLGWGNRPGHENVRWLVDRLDAADYTVDVGEVPVHGRDFEAEYLAPTRDRLAATDPDRILAHSTGGLVAAHLDAPLPRVYLSPWWGLADDPTLIQRLVVSLPIARPVLPRPDDPAAVGDLATEKQLADAPDRLSPAFLRMVVDAQERLPPVREDAVVFCTLQEEIVGLDAIGERVPAERVAVYDGGHEFFASSGRDRTVEWVIAALEDGPAALERPAFRGRTVDHPG